MKILILENPARPLRAADRKKLNRVLKGCEVTTLQLSKERTRGPKNLKADLIIAIGGDGSVLNAAHYANGFGIPIVGFNTGNIGFLTGITPENVTRELPFILEGRARYEGRHALTVKLPNGKEAWALNDVGFQMTARDLFAAELRLNGEKISDYKGDGLIAATATGSTAYNLSLNGPLLAPNSGMIAITPKAPLTLTNRSLVLSDLRVLSIHLKGGPTRVETDSIPIGTVTKGDTVHIHRAPAVIPLVFPANHNHFHAISEKLRWNQNLLSR